MTHKKFEMGEKVIVIDPSDDWHRKRGTIIGVKRATYDREEKYLVKKREKEKRIKGFKEEQLAGCYDSHNTNPKVNKGDKVKILTYKNVLSGERMTEEEGKVYCVKRIYDDGKKLLLDKGGGRYLPLGLHEDDRWELVEDFTENPFVPFVSPGTTSIYEEAKKRHQENLHPSPFVFGWDVDEEGESTISEMRVNIKPEQIGSYPRELMERMHGVFPVMNDDINNNKNNKTMSIIDKFFQSKEDKAMEFFGLGTSDVLNEYGQKEFIDYIYRTGDTSKEKFLETIVRAYKDTKKEK